MHIQWCVKGIAETDRFGSTQVDEIIYKKHGIQSNWARLNPSDVTPENIHTKLTEANLDRHVHDYGAFMNETPFISLAAGAVERRKFLRRNVVHPAVDRALAFATNHNKCNGYLFYCWTLVTEKPAVEVQSLSEPIRDLNIYHRWSRWQLEGEITAKINIPSNQIERVEFWQAGRINLGPNKTIVNPNFIHPDKVNNVREFF